MIKIENIEDLNSTETKPIEDLATLFLTRIIGANLNPLNLIQEFFDTGVHSRNGVIYTITGTTAPNQFAILQYCIDNFHQLITDRPHQLEARINHFEMEGWNTIIRENESFKKSLLDCFGYSRFRSTKKRGLWYAQELNIKTCPYCNAQYTLYIEDKTHQSAKFQFDHFFAKDLYPFLSVSMFNLVPSCSNCNQSKSKTTTSLSSHFHPYHSSFSSLAKFRLRYPMDVSKLGLAELQKLPYSDMEIQLESNFTDDIVIAHVERHNQLYNINGIYSRHKDITRELLVKARLYQGAGADFLTKIEGLFPDKRTVMRYILSSYVEESEINKRPLSKMIQDISKQLKLLP